MRQRERVTKQPTGRGMTCKVVTEQRGDGQRRAGGSTQIPGRAWPGHHEAERTAGRRECGERHEKDVGPEAGQGCNQQSRAARTRRVGSAIR